MLQPYLAPTLLMPVLLMQPAVTLPVPGLLASPSMQLILTGLLTAGVLFATTWLTQRNLRMQLENIRYNGEITTKELEASKEADKLQAVKVEKIEELVVTTHTIVNSQKSEMKADMASQKVELEKVIAQLRSDLLLAQSTGSIRTTPLEQAPAVPVGPLTATIPTVTVPVIEAAPAQEPSRIVLPDGLSRTPQA